jgi:hypothetical protein
MTAIHSDSIFLLGAGFTKAVYHSAPLNAELVEALISDGGDTISKYRDRYNTADIEVLLTRLDIEAIDKEELRTDRSKIGTQIASYFTRYRYSNFSDEVPDWLQIFANNILRNNDSIVSLNYDCFLEGALDSLGVWTPNGGYVRMQNPNADSIPRNPRGIIFLKVHGSENFIESRVDLGKRGQTSIGYLINESIYPVSGLHRNLGGGADQPRPYIIAPSFVKIPHVHIAAMMLDVLKAAEIARNLVIIGCGMRSEDNFLWLLLTRFLNNIIDPIKRLILLGPSSETIWKRISEYWVGDIRRFSKVMIIPCGLAEGISALESSLKD